MSSGLSDEIFGASIFVIAAQRPGYFDCNSEVASIPGNPKEDKGKRGAITEEGVDETIKIYVVRGQRNRIA